MQRRQFLSAIGTICASLTWVRPALAGDDTVSVQRMIDRASRLGTALSLGPGDFHVSGLHLPQSFHLKGVPGRTRLIGIGAGPVLSASGARNLRVSDMIVDARAFGSIHCIHMQNIDGLIIDGCEFAGGAQDALRLEQCSGVVSGNSIEQSGRFGIFAVQSSGLEIERNRVSDCADGGIIIHRWQAGHDGTRIRANTIRNIRADRGGTGQWGNGINLYQTGGNDVSNNDISACAFSAVRANASQNFSVTDNRCTDLGETAIYAEFGYRNAMISRNRINGATNGISAVNADHGGRGAMISANTIRNIRKTGHYEPMAPGFGIGIAIEADTVATANMIDGAERYGINVGWGPHLKDCTVTSNTIKRAMIGIGVSFAPGAGAATISENSIVAASKAIVAHQWLARSTGDLLEAGAAIPGNISLRDNSVA